ncbi:alpha/beta fold hydrolase [Phytomonospora sp. NPDC050363]|uniref:alpha/beta fold hydrolase n=1 Tax=Phytomonospora sp. NPDC050363 TaxID=3155642 RepID=UPI0033EE87E6
MEEKPDTAVFGATGLIGKWTVRRLLGEGRAVAAVVRDPARSGPALRGWLHENHTGTDRLTVLAGELTGGPVLGLSAADDARLTGVRDVFNTAALYRFGMRRAEAAAVNVEGALDVVRWAATRPGLRRLVHVSGYRVGLETDPRHPMPEAELAGIYRRKGAYEGSKIEGDAAVRVAAAELGVPLTVVNPSSVIGHSVTGESGQYIGLAALVEQLWTGRLPALPGTARTFVPVVTVDHLAAFMAAIPDHDGDPGGAHWVLDERTPHLPELVGLLAGHLGVPAPKRLVPVSLVRRLPKAVTRAEPETLGFLTEDRYDTATAERIADSAGLRQAPVETALRRWADRLVADGFGAAPSALPGGFAEVAGARTYLAGERTVPEFVFLHGIPLDGESWRGVLGQLGDSPALVADLPGLGRSAPTAVTDLEWLTELLAPLESRPVLVAHSAGCAPALRYAGTHPDRVGGVVLVSPYFLQEKGSAVLRTPALAAPMLRRASPARLASALVGGTPSPEVLHAVTSAAAQLARPGVARRNARRLREAHRAGERVALTALLGRVVGVRIVAGERDRLVGDPGSVPVATVPGAGHCPQLSDPAAVGAVIREAARH